jgi:chromosome segregation ATPase
MESLDLIEQLVADLIVTTRSLEKGDADREQVGKELELASRRLLPLRNENATLVKDNNELHLEMIRKCEEFDERERSGSADLKSMEKEVSKQVFRANQLEHKLRMLEQQHQALKTQMHRVYSKKGDEAQGVPSYSMMELTQPAALAAREGRSDTVLRAGTSSPPHAAAAELAHGIDVCAALKRQLEECEAERDELRETCARFTSSVAARDKEIQRLGRMVEDGQHLKMIGVKHENESNKRIVTQLNDQVDFLNAQLMEMESEMQRLRALEKTHAKLKGEVSQQDKLLQDARATQARLRAEMDAMDSERRRFAWEQNSHGGGGGGGGGGGEEERMPRRRDGGGGGGGDEDKVSRLEAEHAGLQKRLQEAVGEFEALKLQHAQLAEAYELCSYEKAQLTGAVHELTQKVTAGHERAETAERLQRAAVVEAKKSQAESSRLAVRCEGLQQVTTTLVGLVCVCVCVYYCYYYYYYYLRSAVY